MEIKHDPDWIKASTKLSEAMEQYRDQNYCTSLTKVIYDLIDYIEDHSKKLLNEKTIKRDAGNRSDSKRLYRIPDWRIRIYTKWLYEKVGKERKWIISWLDSTNYSAPGRLLAEICKGENENIGTHRLVKTNVPLLKTRLWGSFLGREDELQRIRQWADHQRYPIAVLYGFGGNGKTTIQQKAGEEFVHGVNCPLRWPYDGAVWISASDYLRGQPRLIDVLLVIAETFDMYTSLSKGELRTIQQDLLKRDVKELLETQRILVLLDNYETVSKSNQVEILQFFNNISGTSQVLISTRYRPDWYLEQDNEDMYRMAHVLIHVDGLSIENTKTMVREFLRTKELPPSAVEDIDVIRLAEITQNNPKTILVLLGLVEQGLSLSQLLDRITSGTTEADHVFDVIIDYTWKEMLSRDEKNVLMAKALFSHSVNEADLGQISGVTGVHLQKAIKTLASISIFEPYGTEQMGVRIKTHSLAQEFVRRVLHDNPVFKTEIEKCWWAEYGPKIIKKAGQTPHESLQPSLLNDVDNVLEHLEQHINERSSYAQQAFMLFAGKNGMGHILLSWSRFNDILRVVDSIKELIFNEYNKALLESSALQLFVQTFLLSGQFDDAERWIGMAVEQNTKLKNRWLDAEIETSRGFLYSHHGYILAEEQSFQKALTIYRELGSVEDIIALYKNLGSLYICIATQNLDDAFDTTGTIEAELTKAEHYFTQAIVLLRQEKSDKDCRYSAQRGIIMRLRGGDLKQARKLIYHVISQAHWSSSVANLYLELALIDHLMGNIEQAHFYERKGTNLLHQLGVLNISKISIFSHCKKVIHRMKQEGTW